MYLLYIFIFILCNHGSTLTDTKSPLKINVKDKDDPLGQIIIPLDEMPSEEHFLKWVALSPHKKNNNPHGELCIDCWVEEFYQDDEELMSPTSGSNKPGKFLRKNLGRLTGNKSPESSRKTQFRRHSSYGTGETSIKGSISLEDISSRGGKSPSPLFGKLKKDKDSLLAPPAYTNMRKSVSTLVLNASSSKPDSPVKVNGSSSNGTGGGGSMVNGNSPVMLTPAINTNISAGSRRNSSPVEIISPTHGLPTIKEQCLPPKVQSIMPTSGPSTGGTLIQINGKYLGNSREDITRLMVAGCNCLDTVEYYTANKIMCTTSESIGIGPITISTRSGGMSSSKMMFEFVETKETKTNKQSTGMSS